MSFVTFVAALSVLHKGSDDLKKNAAAPGNKDSGEMWIMALWFGSDIMN